MGRSGCGPCCGPPVEKELCFKRGGKTYYMVGGIWKTASQYKSYLKNNNQTACCKGLEAIKFVNSKSDYGEYESRVGCWRAYEDVILPYWGGQENVQATTLRYFSEAGATDLEKTERFQSGNPKYGVHIPALWTVTLGDNSGKQIVVTRQLDRDHRIELIEVPIRSFGLGGLSTSLGPYVHNQRVFWNEDSWPDFHTYFPINGRPLAGQDWSISVKTNSVKYLTDIRYDGNQIFNGVSCMVYQIEYTLYNHGTQVTNAATLTYPIMGYPGLQYQPDILGRADQLHSPPLRPYTDFNYCLTFPYFSFNSGVVKWKPGRFPYETELVLDAQGNPIKSDPTQGGPATQYYVSYSTLATDNAASLNGDTYYFEDGSCAGGPFYHADKNLFTEISVMSRDFIVFNPYYQGGGLGQSVTTLSDYDIEVKNDSGGWQWDAAYLGGPYFGYVDNKINNLKNGPTSIQSILAVDSSLQGVVSLPVGWPRLAGPLGKSVETFKKSMTSGIDVIFVSFRTDRSASESGLDIEVDMEVYHPVGSNNEYIITDIIAQGPNLKPSEVKLSNGNVVNVSDIELLQDMFYYGMNERTYYLQLTYLKSLGGDFYNPFKYRVTRIDITNPDIDITCTGDEIAGHPSAVNVAVGTRVLYPIGLDANGNPVVSDEYAIDEIVETGPNPPARVKISNNGIGGATVDVSEISLINPNENPTHITLTRDLSWGSVIATLYPQNTYRHPYFLKLSEGTPATLDFVKTNNGLNPRNIVLTGPATIGGGGPVDLTVPGPWGGGFGGGQARVSVTSRFGSISSGYPQLPVYSINLKHRSRYFDPEDDNISSEDSINVLFGLFDVGSPVFPNGRFLGLDVLAHPTKRHLWGRPQMDKVVVFKMKQSPSNGYLFGGDLNLTFYLQEIDEWKNEQR